MGPQVFVDEEEVIRRLFPGQRSRVTWRVAYSKHPQIEERSHSIQRGEVERESRDAQSLDRPRAGIENV